jgi:hemerythrin-like domain-containing protein
MSTIETLRKEHNQMLLKIHSIEEQQIRTLREAKNQQRSHELTTFEEEFSQFVKSVLFNHFKVEEEALFPVLQNKVKPLTIENLLSDHKCIVNVFNDYLKYVDDFNRSFELLKNLINYIDIHAKKEEELFSSVTLSDEELKKIESRVKLIRL